MGARGKENATFGPGSSGDGMDLPDRAMRAHYNAIENDVVYFLAATALVTSGADSTAQIILSTFYQVFRICHAVFYMLGKQPFRALSFLGGVLCCFTMLAYAFIQMIVNRF